MHRGIATAVLAAMLVAAPAAHAFTLGETGAAAAVQGTLAGNSTLNVAGTINGVKSALGAATDKQNQKLGQVGGGQGWGGKGGGQSRWASNGKGGSGGRGWTSGGGWGANGKSGGMGKWQTASAGGSKAWATGSWGRARN